MLKKAFRAAPFCLLAAAEELTNVYSRSEVLPRPNLKEPSTCQIRQIKPSAEIVNTLGGSEREVGSRRINDLEYFGRRRYQIFFCDRPYLDRLAGGRDQLSNGMARVSPTIAVRSSTVRAEVLACRDSHLGAAVVEVQIIQLVVDKRMLESGGLKVGECENGHLSRGTVRP